MIYEVNRLSDEELQHLLVKESSKLLAGMTLKISYNSIQSLRLNVVQLDNELRRRRTVLLTSTGSGSAYAGRHS